MSVLERYYPGATATIHRKHLKAQDLIWGRTIWSVAKAKQLLGYQPQHNFGEFLTALAQDDTAYYPEAGLPWWGV